MDDDLQQLEAELKSLQPVAPSRELAGRIERDLEKVSPPRALGMVRPLWLAALPIAAALAIVVRFTPGTTAHRNASAASNPSLVQTAGSTETASEAPLKPVAAENVLVSASDEGLVTLDDGTEARRERLHYVDTITWKNQRTNASLTWRVPREEVRVVPVVFQ